MPELCKLMETWRDTTSLSSCAATLRVPRSAAKQCHLSSLAMALRYAVEVHADDLHKVCTHAPMARQHTTHGANRPVLWNTPIASQLTAARLVLHAEQWEAWDVRRSLFDNHLSASFEANMEYMYKHFGFYFPDAECLVDPEGLLKYLVRLRPQGHRCAGSYMAGGLTR